MQIGFWSPLSLVLALMTVLCIPVLGGTYQPSSVLEALMNNGFEMGVGLPYWNPNGGARADSVGPQGGLNNGPRDGLWCAFLTYNNSEFGKIWQQTTKEDGTYIPRTDVAAFNPTVWLPDPYSAKVSGFKIYYTKGGSTTVYFKDTDLAGAYRNWVEAPCQQFIRKGKTVKAIEFFVGGTEKDPGEFWMDTTLFRYYTYS